MTTNKKAEKVAIKKILISISKSSFKSQYIFNKDKSIPEIFFNFFIDLGFDKNSMDLRCFLVSKKYKKDGCGERFIDIHGLNNFHYNLKNNIYDIDIFMGSKKVFLIIRTKKDLQREISDKLFKFIRMEGE